MRITIPTGTLSLTKATIVTMVSAIGTICGLIPSALGAVLIISLAALDIGKSKSMWFKHMTAVPASRTGTMAGQMAKSLGAATTRARAAQVPGMLTGMIILW
mmetsp:Transcript_21499/g.25344  ORF Transcript_21499/g.25344 Transcript_21499/m.25344 type:complete len:102 (-) Transcript_21499:13-318(-)